MFYGKVGDSKEREIIQSDKILEALEKWYGDKLALDKCCDEINESFGIPGIAIDQYSDRNEYMQLGINLACEAIQTNKKIFEAYTHTNRYFFIGENEDEVCERIRLTTLSR